MKKISLMFVFMVFTVFVFAADSSDNVQNIYDPNYTPPPGQEQFYGAPQTQQNTLPPATGQYVPQKLGMGAQPTAAVTPVQTQQTGTEQDPNTVVVTARKIPEVLDFVTRNIQIIPGKNIDALDTVADVLDAQPGIFVNRTSGFEGVSTISLRGASSDQALVLIDGVPLNDIATGGADLTELDTVGIQKIEIVRGGVSSIYGADAMAGVVNILTDPEIKKILTAGAYYGTYNTQKQLLSSSYQLFNMKYAINAVQESSDGYEVNSGYFKRVIDGKIKFNTDMSDTAVSGYYLNREQGVPGSIDYPSPDNKQYDENFDIGADEAINLNPVNVKLDGFLKSGDLKYFDAINGNSRQQQKEWQLSAMGIYSEGGYLSVVGGYEYNQKDLNSSNASLHSVDNNALLANATLKIIKPLVISGGARIDFSSVYGDMTSYNLGVKYDLDANTDIYVSVENSYRAPTFDELYWPSDPAEGFIGNPDLKPETSISYEAGIKKADKVFQESFDWFSREVSNIIENEPIPGNPAMYEPQNIEKARIMGFEGKAGMSLSESDAIQAGYTYTNAVDALTGEVLPNTPQGKLNARFEKQLPFSLKADVDYEYVDSRIGSFGYMLKPYSLMNAGISQKLSENINLSIEIDNIFNNTTYNTYSYYNMFTLSNVEGGYLMPGRTVMAGGKIAF